MEHQRPQELRWAGTNDHIVWKSPIHDFYTGSSVIVNETQVAVFYLNGQCAGVLPAGHHVLESCKIAFIQNLVSKLTRTHPSFSADVYYVNLVQSPKMHWGIGLGPGAIPFTDLGFSFGIGARGLYYIKAFDPRRLIEKLNGTDTEMNYLKLEDTFRELVCSALRSRLISTLRSNNISIKYSNDHCDTIVKGVLPEIEELFDEYGVEISKFVIEQIYWDDSGEEYKKYNEIIMQRESQNEAYKVDLERQRLEQQYQETRAKTEELTAKADIQKEKMAIELEAYKEKTMGEAKGYSRAKQGYSYQDERKFDVLQDAASNQSEGGGGGIASQFMQLGVGLGTAGVVSDMMKSNLNSLQPGTTNTDESEKIVCINCGTKLPPNSAFCFNCGSKVVPKGKIICPSCGEIVSEGKFCLSCGAPLISRNICSKCGHELEEGARFCPECGTPRG